VRSLTQKIAYGAIIGSVCILMEKNTKWLGDGRAGRFADNIQGWNGGDEEEALMNETRQRLEQKGWE
jgi:hypothetical protein